MLALIFDWSCTDQVVGPFRCMPVDIGKVCRLWREITYSNPKIWTSLCWPTAGDFKLGSAHGRLSTMFHYINLCFRAMKGLPSSQLISFDSRLTTINRTLRVKMIERPGPASVSSVFAQYTDQWGALRLSDDIPYKAHRRHSYSQLHTLDLKVSVTSDASTMGTGGARARRTRALSRSGGVGHGESASCVWAAVAVFGLGPAPCQYGSLWRARGCRPAARVGPCICWARLNIDIIATVV
ncbi:hypothetical protein BD626DRAFT_100532 [Schizophyllum amplum]|uniref:F-box domain-containing protein n=1 Tax=Schizophyllum amplum TaxID=97359 RepID=A0A550CRI6_9AGAR|nr:hypothetical protein BD626DRAFT_100532 [Auriculariopsis ampla]